MQSHIPDDLASEITQLARGLNVDVDDAVREALENWVTQHRQPVGLPKKIDFDTLVAQQGVKPLTNPAADLKADFWPADESADDIISAVRELRSHGTPRVR